MFPPVLALRRWHFPSELFILTFPKVQVCSFLFCLVQLSELFKLCVLLSSPRESLHLYWLFPHGFTQPGALYRPRLWGCLLSLWVVCLKALPCCGVYHDPFPFYDQLILYSVGTTHFVYPFINQWAFGLLLPLGQFFMAPLTFFTHEF